jgi:hypothetical protein
VKHHYGIYKIGCTNDFNRRINEYIIDTQVISICPIENKKKCERELIREFKSEFEFRNDIGNEYFECNGHNMVSVFNDYCSDYFPTEIKRSIEIIIGKLEIKD